MTWVTDHILYNSDCEANIAEEEYYLLLSFIIILKLNIDTHILSIVQISYSNTLYLFACFLDEIFVFEVGTTTISRRSALLSQPKTKTYVIRLSQF